MFAIVGKGETCTKIFEQDLTKYKKIYFINEAFLFSPAISLKVECEMFCIDAEPVFRVCDFGLGNFIVNLPEFPHFCESKGTLKAGAITTPLGLSLRTYNLKIQNSITEHSVVAINSTVQACLSYIGFCHFGVQHESVDIFGVGGKSHQLMNFPKTRPRESYLDQRALLVQIANFYSLKVNYL